MTCQVGGPAEDDGDVTVDDGVRSRLPFDLVTTELVARRREQTVGVVHLVTRSDPTHER